MYLAVFNYSIVNVLAEIVKLIQNVVIKSLCEDDEIL